MIFKRVFFSMLLITFIWSCSRESVDQGIKPFTNAKDTNKKIEEPETIPPPLAGDLTFEVNEEVLPNDIIARMITGSSDAKLSFQILEDLDELFVLTNKGELSLAEGKRLDYETKMVHNIRVAVSDGTNEPVEFNVSINVLDDQGLKDEPTSFVTKWRIKEGETLTIGTHPDYSYDYFIDWGDGTVESLTMQNPNHKYAEEGIYTVAINGQFPSISMQFADNSSRLSLIDVSKWGDKLWYTMEGAFNGCERLRGFSAVDQPNLEQAGSMARMFQGAKKFNHDIVMWNTKNVSSMRAMFQDAESFDQEITDWNTANVKDMSFMFYQAKAFNQHLGDWDLSSITSMENMLSHSNLSQDNYKKTLKGWASKGEDQIPDGIVFGAEGLFYCNYVDVVYARKKVLAEQNGWIIKDAGMKECK